MTDRDLKIQNIADALLRLHMALRDAGLNNGAAAIVLAEENDLCRLRMGVRVSPTFWRDSLGTGDEVKIDGVGFVSSSKAVPANPRLVGEIAGISIFVDERMAPDTFKIVAGPKS
jgi:hypothetical protein